MGKRVRYAVCAALLMAGTAVQAAPRDAAQAVSPRQTADWVAASNRNTALVLEAQAKFDPEDASGNGLSAYDGLATDLAPRRDERRGEALSAVIAELKHRREGERDPRIRQDLDILIQSVTDDLEGTRLRRKYFLSWTDAPQAMFGGIKVLLDDQVEPNRRAKAVELLRRYVGDWPGTTPLTDLAKQRFEELRAPGLLGPDKVSVDNAIANAGTYADGIRKLFAKYKVTGAERALAKLDAQVAAYTAWTRATILPIARTDYRLPPEMYAFRLKQFGIDIDPRQLIAQAQVEFAETRAAMIALAPRVAADKGLTPGSYVDVIRQLKRGSIPDDRIEASYAEVNRTIEAAIRRERIVTLPQRPMKMRLASAAESAAQPAPHMEPPPLLGNKGEYGTFVLPVGVPGKGPEAAYDDFNFPAAQWTVSAHEGRPGHELQFSAMLEGGVSQARILYAFNSVNVEGWALYAEAEALPHHPIEGQLMAYQARLLRAARAFLDPMLNLGLISIDDARRVLLEQVATSPAMAKQEIERYTSRAPGQAGSYFYGYTRLLRIRIEAELALGPKFDRLAFNDFLLRQGLLPPDLLEKAVLEAFVPQQRAR
ncbi:MULTISPECIES: DUF885 domain-containing protein [unclassified Sphingomonas]|uniref:DUF885 domain-containing protein n=1 Tax=unclassified Sphingomonas TaxID=196159 RepID=UPI0006F21F11|nr:MULTISPECIES: DUF885 domain-containing protein [unclassified Sphingomonas]KQM64001.1 hypothetical protein ASE65_16310 [Sphingomonas sp. Leaf16]KQN13404.1 hypothetical protein ASE81_03025 [Sphingomonas sp. Leaf29]KQN21296.1 hypothetical protein ASE83_16290 [Sphingomonas sp. Leaf32]